MSEFTPFNSLLVPVDFSAPSQAAFEWALRYVGGGEPSIIVIHVLDISIIETIAAHEFAALEEVGKRMRERAEEQLAEYHQPSRSEVEIDTLAVEGLPFLEIIRKADDFAVDAVVMGRVGTRGHFEKLLFGSTAEKVLRGCRRPVIVLPSPDAS